MTPPAPPEKEEKPDQLAERAFGVLLAVLDQAGRLEPPVGMDAGTALAKLAASGHIAAKKEFGSTWDEFVASVRKYEANRVGAN